MPEYDLRCSDFFVASDHLLFYTRLGSLSLLAVPYFNDVIGAEAQEPGMRNAGRLRYGRIQEPGGMWQLHLMCGSHKTRLTFTLTNIRRPFANSDSG